MAVPVQKKMLTLLVMAALMVEVTKAADYTVGVPGNGWDFVTDLETWASARTFYVGDNIHFSYSETHSVLEVTKRDYDSCVISTLISSDFSGSTTIHLDSPTTRYFICGTSLHCTLGMRVVIATLAPTSKTPSPPLVTKSPSPPLPPTRDSSSSSSSSSSLKIYIGPVIAVAVAVVIGLVKLSLVVISSSKNRREDQSNNSHMPPPPPPPTIGFSLITFTHDELAKATNGFSKANLLGQGGFGYVHRGVLPNGEEVAVKQLKDGSGQGDPEFLAEVEIISRVHHKHLVSLVGYCMTGSDRLLVYKFVPNRTMEFHLHGKGRPVMDWPTRLKIAIGSAKGLAYLHEDCHPKIIHRDIKAANILIDLEFEAKVADFGLAKLSSDANTHVLTRIMGTFGYLAPEYAASGKLTEKSDVFSFGVMLLELITGRRPADTNNTYTGDCLVDWVRPLLTRALEVGNFSTLVDERLKNNYNHDEMLRMVSCAAASVRHSARQRPRMSQIVRALEGHSSLSDLNEGIIPGHSPSYSSHGSSDYDTNQYNKDMEKFRKMALGTQETGSSGYSSGNPTSEYGWNPPGSSSQGKYTTEMAMGKMKRNNHGFS